MQRPPTLHRHGFRPPGRTQDQGQANRWHSEEWSTILPESYLQAGGPPRSERLLLHDLHLLFVHTTAVNLELGQSTVNLLQVFCR
jgi:hypothetical protein